MSRRYRDFAAAHPVVLAWCRSRQWSRVGRRLGISYDEAKAFGAWAKTRDPDTAEPDDEPEPAEPEPDSPIEDLAGSYWLDRERGRYVFHLPTRGAFALPADTVAAMREAYSNLGGGATVNQIALRFGMARPTTIAIIRALGLTHDSPPWGPEEVEARTEDELVDDLLQRKTERVIVKAERKAWSRVKKSAEAFERFDLFAARMAEHFTTVAPRYTVPRLRLPRASRPFQVVLSPTDFHWGKRGVDGYDRETARARLFGTTDRLLDRIVHRGAPEQILLMLGSDGLHIDNARSETTRGTAQDCDGSPEELASSWVMLCAAYVDHVRQVAPVRVHVIPGNHDAYTSVLLRTALSGWFRHADDVEVIPDLSSRQYYRYGRSLLVFLHGDIGKARDWVELAAEEARVEWGETDRTFVFCGHLHTERELEQRGGAIVYRMPSLAGTDRWHKRLGYVASRKALAAFIVDAERGVIATEVEPAER